MNNNDDVKNGKYACKTKADISAEAIAIHDKLKLLFSSLPP